MDKKDTQKNHTMSNGHQGQDEIKSLLYKDSFTMSLTLKKTEKIITALYMVTDCLPEGEPLCNHLRTTGLAFASKMHTLCSYFAEPKYTQVDDTLRLIEEMQYYLDMGMTVRLISPMNTSILSSELTKVRDNLIETYKKSSKGKVHADYNSLALDPEMFSVSENLLTENKGHFDKGHLKDINVLYKKEPVLNKTTRPLVGKSNIGVKIARRNDVLNIIKAKGTVSLKDIKEVLKDITDKTIQRELRALVEEGVLEKMGEKRWSTYRLAKQ